MSSVQEPPFSVAWFASRPGPELRRRRGRARERLPVAVALPVAACVTVLFAACSEGAAPHDTVARVDTLPSGRVVVANTGVPTWDEDSAWRLVEDLRLGGAEEPDDPEQFSFVTGLAVDDEGRLHVLDGLDQTVRVFDAAGAPLHVLGGGGEGPGQLRRAAGVHIAPDGALWVADPGNRRYSIYGRDGELVEDLLRPISTEPGPWSAGFLDDGSLLDWALAFPAEEPGVVAGSRIHFIPIRFSPDMSRADTLPLFAFSQRMLNDGSRPAVFFDNRLVVVPGGDGAIWFAESVEYRVGRRAPSGDTLRVFTLAVESAPVGDSDRAMVRERAGPDRAGPYLESLPATKPVVLDVFGDDSGHLFVVPEAAGVPGGSAIDVFTDEGRYLGRLSVPRPFSTRVRPVATPGHLYVVELDELDVPYVTRLRIERR